jgi:hypothetical protein
MGVLAPSPNPGRASDAPATERRLYGCATAEGTYDHRSKAPYAPSRDACPPAGAVEAAPRGGSERPGRLSSPATGKCRPVAVVAWPNPGTVPGAGERQPASRRGVCIQRTRGTDVRSK